MNAPATLTLPLTPMARRQIEAAIEQLVALLDQADGDADLEADSDDEDGADTEPGEDGEPWLGWVESAGRGAAHFDLGDDRELDRADDEWSDQLAEAGGLEFRGDGAAIAQAMLRTAWRQRGGKTIGR